jgi:hypothetical protein
MAVSARALRDGTFWTERAPRVRWDMQPQKHLCCRITAFTIKAFTLSGMLALWPMVVSAQSLKSPMEYSKGENRRVLEEILEQTQEALRTLDAPETATEERQRRNRRERGQPRIVNGRGTINYPASGALLFGDNSYTASAWCSGTLINMDKFLTAAHCIAKDPTPSKYYVYFHSAGFFKVKAIDWLKNEYKFPRADVAILTLEAPVPRILPEPINRADTPLYDTLGTVVGFGRTGGFNEDYGIKREGFIQTAKCPVHFSGIALVCWNFSAEVQNGVKRSNTCNADSGGPLFIYEVVGGRQFRVLAGITSGGEEDDCLLGDHSYDADVFHYRKWIEETAGLSREVRAFGDGPLVVTERDVMGESAGLSEQRPEVAFPFEVRDDIDILMVAMNGDDNGKGRNNFDLYVIPGNGTIDNAVCKEDGPGQFAFCTINKPITGQWKAVVRHKRGRGLAQVVVTQIPKITQQRSP